MELVRSSDGFVLISNGQTLFEHSRTQPALFVGSGHARMECYRGNFEIEDYLSARIPLTHATITPKGDEFELGFAADADSAAQVTLITTSNQHGFDLIFHTHDESINRVWIRLPSDAQERVYGCGEQMSYFNLKGRHFPLWTSEPGVGRDKKTEITFKSDVAGKAGGDYYHTNYPQPTFMSSKHYSCHVETTAYADFDFRYAQFHELHVWAVPKKIELRTASCFLDLIEQLSARFGRQPALPEWVYNGVILGLKGGEQSSFTRLENALSHGVNVSALWCEDWAGIRTTSFGKRLFWDWKWSHARYPTLDKRIKELSQRNIRFMAYVNPYLCNDFKCSR
jgi:sulfoquinovosidase